MKTLFLMRHGKAADPYDYDEDFERPLVERGKNEVREAAVKLANQPIRPMAIAASPALRTSQTARIVAEVLNIPVTEIQFLNSLYMGSVQSYMDAINQCADHTLICGHNPSTGQLAMHFSRGKIVAFPTSSIVSFQFTKLPVTLHSMANLQYAAVRK